MKAPPAGTPGIPLPLPFPSTGIIHQKSSDGLHVRAAARRLERIDNEGSRPIRL